MTKNQGFGVFSLGSPPPRSNCYNVRYMAASKCYRVCFDRSWAGAPAQHAPVGYGDLQPTGAF